MVSKMAPMKKIIQQVMAPQTVSKMVLRTKACQYEMAAPKEGSSDDGEPDVKA